MGYRERAEAVQTPEGLVAMCRETVFLVKKYGKDKAATVEIGSMFKVLQNYFKAYRRSDATEKMYIFAGMVLLTLKMETVQNRVCEISEEDCDWLIPACYAVVNHASKVRVK